MAASTTVAEITARLPQGDLELVRFTAVERLSEPFSIICEVASADRIDFTKLIGTSLGVTTPGEDPLSHRPFHGVLTEATLVTVGREEMIYRLVLRPWLWTLSLRRNSRIFQAQTTQDIVSRILQEAQQSDFQFKTQSAGSTPRNYTVQYEESDFSFISRLMEEEGMYYYFEHTPNKHTMVICDGPSSHQTFSGGKLTLNREAEAGWTSLHLWDWTEQVHAAPDAVSLYDSNLHRYGETLAAATAGDPVGELKAEVFHYPGGYGQLSDAGVVTGDNYAKLKLQGLHAEKLRYVGEGDTFALTVGAIASIDPVSSRDQRADVLVIAATHSYEGQTTSRTGGEANTVVFEAIPSTTVWRPPLATPKPIARGPQVATVVGASGEVIDPDQFGRVKVQFPWDRVGQNDQNSSCWIRVSQGWADKGFGMMHLPRIGEEVIVDFFDGDMDRPVITGRVYNATKTTPYALPADKTKSTWKSQTVGESGSYPDTVDPPAATPQGFNEIRFEDKGGSEEVFVHAQRLFTAWYRFDETRTTGHNTTVKVGYNRDVTIKNNETKTVQEGDETHTVSQGNLTQEVTQGNETHTVKAGKRTTTIYGNESLTVQQGDETHEVSLGKRTSTIFGDDATTVQTGNWKTDVSVGAATLTALQKITLQVGPTSIELTPEGITLQAMQININGEVMTKVQGGAMVQVQGGVVMIN